MKLKSVRVQMFRNILDSGDVEIQGDVTCLVGKNESGKSAFLEALRRLNPAPSKPKFDVAAHYPAWLEKRHRLQGKDLDAVTPISAIFVLDDEDKIAFEETFGPSVLTKDEIMVSRSYGDELAFDYDINVQKAVANLVGGLDLPTKIAAEVKKVSTFEALIKFADELELEGDGAEQNKAARDSIKKVVVDLCGKDIDINAVVIDFLEKRLPSFFYFAEYSRVPGIVKIHELLKTEESKLDGNLVAARSLLTMAAAEKDYLLNVDYERRKRELERIPLDWDQAR